jgi:DNA-binding LytR/AlgR family response regulator
MKNNNKVTPGSKTEAVSSPDLNPATALAAHAEPKPEAAAEPVPAAEPLRKQMLFPFEGMRVVRDVDQISYICCDGGYCTVHFIDKSSLISCHSLDKIECMLKGYGFFRISRWCLICIKQVEKADDSDAPYVLLFGGTQEYITRRRKKDFIDLYLSF